ncbi:MAG: hypothetical protein ACOCZU_06780, partial [Planctomycetota bacterium]
MIDAKKAVNAASDYFREVTGYSGDVTVEEIELDESDEYWWVTLGYLKEELSNPFGRAFKAFRVRASDG